MNTKERPVPNPNVCYVYMEMEFGSIFCGPGSAIDQDEDRFWIIAEARPGTTKSDYHRAIFNHADGILQEICQGYKAHKATKVGRSIFTDDIPPYDGPTEEQIFAVNEALHFGGLLGPDLPQIDPELESQFVFTAPDLSGFGNDEIPISPTYKMNQEPEQGRNVHNTGDGNWFATGYDTDDTDDGKYYGPGYDIDGDYVVGDIIYNGKRMPKYRTSAEAAAARGEQSRRPNDRKPGDRTVTFGGTPDDNVVVVSGDNNFFS